MSLIIMGGDLHIPYEDKKAVNRFLDAVGEAQPDHVVFMGDILDYYHLSHYLHEPNNASTYKEIKEGRKFFDRVRNIVSDSCEIDFLEGNHEMRMRKYILRKVPEFFGIPAFNTPSLLRLEEIDIKWWPLEKDLIIDGFLFRHGDYVRPKVMVTAKKHIQEYGHQKMVVGHSHRLGIFDIRHPLPHERMVGIESGCLCTYEAAKHYRHRPHWTKGYVMLDDGQPYIFEVDKKG